MAITDGLNRFLISNYFGDLIYLQAEISNLAPGWDFANITPEKVTETSFALIDEVMELAKELGWKTWKEVPVISTPEDKARVLEELADVMAFFNLLVYVTMCKTKSSVADVLEAYLAKSEKNVRRLTGQSDEVGYGIAK